MHRESAARGELDDGRLVEVTFDLPPSSWPEIETESLWAEQVGANLFVLRSSPFFAEGVSFDDVVRAERVGGSWMFRGVHAPGGHTTVRLYRLGARERGPWKHSLAPVRALGCSFESADGRFATLDVPRATDVHAVLAALRRGEREGRWEFEVAHYGHPSA